MRAQNLAPYVMTHGVAVLHGAFDPLRLWRARDIIFEAAPSRTDDNPPHSSTPHRFRGFQAGGVPEVQDVFDDLVAIQNKLTEPREDYIRQAIQYPRGGGFFDEHDHDLEPQRIGLILMASQRGRDYLTGNVRFKINGEWREVFLNSGDVCLFRHDLPHDITSVDPDAPLDWSKSDGRWTFVLSVPGAR